MSSLGLTGQRFLWRIYGLVALVPFLCVADQALGHLGLLPASATTLCLAMLIPFNVHLFYHHIHSRSLALALRPWRENALPLLAFFSLASFSLIFSTVPHAYWDEGGKWIFLLPYGFIVTLSSLAVGLHEPVVKSLRLYIFLSLVLLGYSLWYDLCHPGTFSEIQNRAAGFSGNANYTALVSVLVCSVGIDFGRSTQHPHHRFEFEPISTSARVWSDVGLLFLCFTIVTMTMSRSGLVVFIVLAGSFVVLRLFRSQRTTKMLLHCIVAAGVLVFVAISALPFLATEISAGDRNNRLSRFLNSQQIDDGSAGTRLAAVVDSVRLIEEAPLLGHGTGFSRTMLELPHNLYLQQWVNNGVVGLLNYIALLTTSFLVFLRRGDRNGQVFIAIAAVGSIFSHNVLDQRPFLMLLGILLAASLVDQHRPNTPMSRLRPRSDSRRSRELPHALADRAIQG